MTALRVTTIGNSVCVILPKELQQRLRVSKGDTLFATEGAGGTVTLTPYDPDFAAIMEAAEIVLHEDREALRELSRR